MTAGLVRLLFHLARSFLTSLVEVKQQIFFFSFALFFLTERFPFFFFFSSPPGLELLHSLNTSGKMGYNTAYKKEQHEMTEEVE